MALDPQVVAYRAARAVAGAAPRCARTLAEARAADLAAIRAGGGAVEPVHQVRDTHVPGPAGPLPVREQAAAFLRQRFGLDPVASATVDALRLSVSALTLEQIDLGLDGCPP